MKSQGEKNKTLTPLKDIISQLGKQGLPFDLEDGQIWKVWEKLIDKNIAKNAYPIKIKNKVLFLRVSSPIWIQELRYKQKEIKEKINSTLGRKAVKEIKFKME